MTLYLFPLLWLGSPPNYTCGQESKGLYINQEVSTGDTPVPQKDEESIVALEQCSMEIENGQQEAQNQSSEAEHSIIISLVAVKENIEEQSEISLKVSQIGPKTGLISADDNQLVVAQHQSDDEDLEKHRSPVASQHCQREGEVSVIEQTDTTLQQIGSVHSVAEQLTEPTLLNKEVANEAPKSHTAVGESNSQPVRRKRGRPSKKAKCLQQPVKVLRSKSITEEEKVTSPVSKEEVQVSSAVDKSKKTSSVITQSFQDKVNTLLVENADNQVGSLPVSEVSLRKRSSYDKDKTNDSQIFMEMEDAESRTPFNQASSTSNTLRAPSLEAKHHHTLATLQDAMLLVEAMNQSSAENALSSPQKKAVLPQTKCAPLVGKLHTVDEVPAKPVQTAQIAEKLPATDLPTSKLSKGIHNAASETRDTASNEAQAHLTGSISSQQNVVPFRTITLPVPLSAAAQTSVGSVQLRTLHPQVSVATTILSNKAPPKIFVIPKPPLLMPPRIATLSLAQRPTVVSTVGARNPSLLPAPAAVGIHIKTPPYPPVIQDAICVTTRKLLPVVTAQSKSTSKKQLSKVIIYPRPPPSQMANVYSAKQDLSKSPSPVTEASPQLSCSSPKLKASDVQTTSVKVATTLSQNKVNISDNLETPKQTSSDPATTDALTKYALPAGQRSAIVRLTRLPFLVYPKESFSASSLNSPESSETRSILKDNATEKISTHTPETPVFSADSCSDKTETSISVSINICQKSKEPCDVQNKVSASTKMSNYLEPSASPSVSTPEISDTEHSPDQPTFTLDKEITTSAVQNSPTTDSPPVEKQPAASIQLTAFTSKDTSDPHLKMTKTQFLAQLAVSPIVHNPEKVI